MLPSRQSSQLTVANDQCVHTDTTILTLYHYVHTCTWPFFLARILARSGRVPQARSSPRGVVWHAPSENFEKMKAVGAFWGHSAEYFGRNLYLEFLYFYREKINYLAMRILWHNHLKLFSTTFLKSTFLFTKKIKNQNLPCLKKYWKFWKNIWKF